ncbi:hypothetical protein ABZP36_035621 [Zizania latifolia]
MPFLPFTSNQENARAPPPWLRTLRGRPHQAVLPGGGAVQRAKDDAPPAPRVRGPLGRLFLEESRDFSGRSTTSTSSSSAATSDEGGPCPAPPGRAPPRPATPGLVPPRSAAPRRTRPRPAALCHARPLPAAPRRARPLPAARPPRPAVALHLLHAAYQLFLTAPGHALPSPGRVPPLLGWSSTSRCGLTPAITPFSWALTSWKMRTSSSTASLW